MKVTTGNGWVFDTDGGFALSATQYAHGKGFKDIVVVWAEKENEKEYVVLRNNVPVYTSKQFEAIGVWIDLLQCYEAGKEK